VRTICARSFSVKVMPASFSASATVLAVISEDSGGRPATGVAGTGGVVSGGVGGAEAPAANGEASDAPHAAKAVACTRNARRSVLFTAAGYLPRTFKSVLK
jgi:hypothetical protein